MNDYKDTSLGRAYLSILVLLSLASACAMPSDSPEEVQSRVRTTAPPPISLDTEQGGALIYAGDTAWEAEVNSIAYNLYLHHTAYREVSANEINEMSLAQLSSYQVIIIPGGDALTITSRLTPDTHKKMRDAVQKNGTSFLGFCAGAWLAVAPAPLPGHDVSYGIGLVDGPILQQTKFAKEGYNFTITAALFPDGSKHDLLWYGGPVTPSFPGGVIAKYPDGTPAISQIPSGKGLVFLSGLHPTATRFILQALGLENAVAINPDFTWKLIEAAIQKKRLPAF